MLGTAAALMTEILSPFRLVRRGPLVLAWPLVLVAAIVYLWRHRPAVKVTLRRVETIIGVGIAIMASLIGYTAWLSPPNSADAMAYHMARVVYWAQAGSVAFYPTSYLNQIMMQPLAEYCMLHSYVIFGGDRFINLVTTGTYLGSIIAVSLLAAALGLRSRAQAFAALFCATLPNFVLQASGAKNDGMLALWLTCLVYFANVGDLPFTGLSAGLALATKGTAYLFAPPMLAAALLLGNSIAWRQLAGWLATGILLINGPQYARNIGLSGSLLGFDSAHGDGFFRWRNEHFGWKPTVSNVLRNLSEQLGSSNSQWNQAVFDSTVSIHRALGIDPQSPDTTWRWSEYQPPRNANHEANGPNRWALLILLIAAIYAGLTHQRRWMLWAAGLAVAFLLFCFYLKWQPYLARLELPLFVLGAPLAAFLLDSLRPPVLAVVACVFLMNNTRPEIFENWTRRLKGPGNLFVTSRDQCYFNDLTQFGNSPEAYFKAVNLTAQSGCSRVGIDTSRNSLEYPFQALLLERNAIVRFFHLGVENASASYARSDHPGPCAVLCIECAGDQKKIAAYSNIGAPATIGRFLLFLEGQGRQR
jgi:hypothetical protein